MSTETEIIDGKDWFLQTLVDLVDGDRENKLDITLMVSGLTITGTMVSAGRYFEELDSPLAHHASDGAEFLKGYISELSHLEVSKIEKVDLSKLANGLPGVDFIHLIDCQIVDASGNRFPNNLTNSLWRGRLSEVDGFILGRLSKEDPV